ncbi:MAG: TlpA family protein disulfide reductase, partial [Clostridia bacterium]|nr:TlpA family protein disulfide reductase [Clostridia bacterium]
QLPDFTVTCYDGSTFHLKDQRGKVTFINFWATHCTPCIQELPHFDALYRAHEDDIAMIAIHSYFVTKDPEEFLADKGYVLSFAHDSDNSLMDMVKGTGTLPQTVVLNRKGEVIYNKVGSVTPELLEALYEEAAK